MATTMPSFPDAASTGVRDGVTLKDYYGDLTITQDGADISGLRIHGTVTIKADNVTFHDNQVLNSGGYWDVYVPDGYSGAVIDHNDLSGAENGISGTATIAFNDISGVENGVNVYGKSYIHDNFIHDLAGSSDAHYDGIEVNGGGVDGTLIQHNTIINDYGQTSAIMLGSDFGTAENVTVDSNFLAGGGYTVYSASATNVFSNNYLGQGYWGYYDFTGGDAHLTGNVDLGTHWTAPTSGDTGGTVTPPPPAPTPDPTPAPTPEPNPDETHPGYTTVNGTDKSDVFHGTDGADWIHGGAGNDVINGWGGADVLYGDAGRDTFQFGSIWSADGDKVMDFQHGVDRLDFHLIDANPNRRGDQKFAFDGYNASGKNGHIWLTDDAFADVTHLHVKVGGNEVVVDVHGAHLGLTASDFIL